MNKKGASLGSMYPAVLAIVIVGILIGVGLYVLDSTAEAVSNTKITVTNETGLNFTAGDTLAKSTECGADNFVITVVDNGTDVIPSTFYSVDIDTAVLSNLTADIGYDLLNVSYTYDGTTRTGSTDTCEVLGTAGTGIGGLASWIAVIVVVLAAAIVLGIVLSSFGRGTGAV